MRKSFLILVCALATSLCAADFSGKSSDELIKSLNTKDPVVLPMQCLSFANELANKIKLFSKCVVQCVNR